MMKNFFFIPLAALTFAMSGCKYDDARLTKDVEDLKKRVSTLEDTVGALGRHLENGSLITAVNPLEDGSGYRIEFSNGASRAESSIDILHGTDGNHGVSPQIEVRNNSNGSTSIWYKTDGDWTNTGVDISGSAPGNAGPTGPQGPAGITPQIEVREIDGKTVICYKTTGDWISTGVDLKAPASANPLLSIVDNEADGTVTFVMNDSKTPHDSYTFEKASTVVRFEIMTISKIAITETATGKIVFRVNPSTAWVPTGSGTAIDKWELDQVETRAGYVTTPTDFSLAGILPDGDKQGQYIAAIKCDDNAAIGEYAMALVLDNGKGDLVSSSPFVLAARERQIPQPFSWDDVQPTIDGMNDGDILDLKNLAGTDPAAPLTLTIRKSITVTAYMDPWTGFFGGPNDPFQGVHFLLADNPTVVFEDIMVNNDDAAKSTALISGQGNVEIIDSEFMHYKPIDLEGDVTMRGDYGVLFTGFNNPGCHVIGVQTRDGTTPPPAIKAHNVTILGASVRGANTMDVPSEKAGSAIVASGDVVIEGDFRDIPDHDAPFFSANIEGGWAVDGGDGGDAIVAAGKVTANGGAILGGWGYGESGVGGSGIVAGGDVTLAGERKYYDNLNTWYFSCHVLAGPGAYVHGVPFIFSVGAPGESPAEPRTLTANTVMIRDMNRELNGIGAPYTFELQADDRAIFDDCIIGWFGDRPIFSGGYYKITNPFAMWGTFDGATEIED